MPAGRPQSHLLVVMAAGAALGCAHQARPARPAALIEHLVRPQDADPAADRWIADQYAALDAGAARAGKLVVYLVGANSKPSSGRPMMALLAAWGFHVIAPAYANDYPMRDLCERADPDQDCHGKARLEAFEGRDHSPHIAVSRPNSTEERVARMLAYLDWHFPREGWGAFLQGGAPRWPAIIVAGHSHGASSAALIGKVRRVNRVVMLSGPFDNRSGAAALWTRREPATPNDRVYGLSHAGEPQHQGHLTNWAAMGLPALGAVVQVDGGAPPYGGSHQLVTALPGKSPHGVTAAGPASPTRPDGGYLLEPAWAALFGR
jgi:hypothetical protein